MKNYHNEEVQFSSGNTVTHVTDEGAMVAATVLSVDGETLKLAFADGDEGEELATSCFHCPVNSVTIGGAKFEFAVPANSKVITALRAVMVPEMLAQMGAEGKTVKVSAAFAMQLEAKFAELQ
jgi:hypothetical protein